MSDINNQDENRIEENTAIEKHELHHDARKEEVQKVKSSPELLSPSAKRRERIRQLEARLERERSRENAATRKERNGQLFVWGAMVEGVYRNGNDHEREQVRQWVQKHLSDNRHRQRAEFGFARIDEEKADSATVQREN